MFNNILISVSNLIGVIGTIYAVLSILGLNVQETKKAITFEGIENADKNLLIQKKQAITGIPLVALGWIGQTVFTFLKITDLSCFVMAFIGIIMFVCFEIIITSRYNSKFQKKYDKYKNASTAIQK